MRGRWRWRWRSGLCQWRRRNLDGAGCANLGGAGPWQYHDQSPFYRSKRDWRVWHHQLYGQLQGRGGTARTGIGTASPIDATGLTNGTAYDCSIAATNATGNSASSTTSSATPCSPTPNSLARCGSRGGTQEPLSSRLIEGIPSRTVHGRTSLAFKPPNNSLRASLGAYIF